MLAPRASSASAFQPGVRVSPLDFGADPLGKRDSTAALQQCVAACVNYSSSIDALGHFPGDASFGNGRYIANAGGCQIDLGGGEFLLSSTVMIPEYIGNLQLGHGSLVADEAFANGTFLLQVGIPDSCNVPQGSCNVDLGFPELFLDGRHVASGLQINNVMGTTVGPGAYFLNCASRPVAPRPRRTAAAARRPRSPRPRPTVSYYGLQINKGHEVMLDRAWLGETNFDFPFSVSAPPKAVAIQVNGNDHYIVNTVVFSSMVGLQVNGAANYVTGTHVWFPENQALAFEAQGVMAFHITQAGNRFNGCYIDGSRAVFEGAALSRNVWTNGFECCAAVKNKTHGVLLLGDDVGPGLVITHNEFAGGTVYWQPTTSSLSAPKSVVGVRIETNSFNGNGMGSRATITQAAKGGTSFTFDFCALLTFPAIDHVDAIAVSALAGFPAAVARAPTGCIVVVETSEALNGNITVTVDSSASGGGHFV
jgi:hypothetical protein